MASRCGGICLAIIDFKPQATTTLTMPRRSRSWSRARAKLLNVGLGESRADRVRSRGRGYTSWVRIALAGITISLFLVLIRWLASDSPTRLRSKAEAATQAGNWHAAVQYWRAINATSFAQSYTYLGEARACLALGQAVQAESSLHRAITADPSVAESSQLLLQILLIEDRTLEAQQLGWKVYAYIGLEARPALLRALTLGLLTELPDDQIRIILHQWIDADPGDLNAQIALWQRISLQPRASDPDRPSVLAALEALLAKHPDHISTREALITVLADSGEPDRGRVLLEGWPMLKRDARYWRLRGRWDLEYDHRPQQAVAALQTALVDLPQDWRSWYRLARALHILGRDDESQRATEAVTRIREVLDPLILEPRLHAAFDNLNDPAALRDLAALCKQVGLKQLAEAWLTEAHRQTQP
jgi:tetratricopeptide (TPR) repeat protein